MNCWNIHKTVDQRTYHLYGRNIAFSHCNGIVYGTLNVVSSCNTHPTPDFLTSRITIYSYFWFANRSPEIDDQLGHALQWNRRTNNRSSFKHRPSDHQQPPICKLRYPSLGNIRMLFSTCRERGLTPDISARLSLESWVSWERAGRLDELNGVSVRSSSVMGMPTKVETSQPYSL